LIEIGSKTAEKIYAQTDRQTNKQTDRHYENNGHLAVNEKGRTDAAHGRFDYIRQVVLMCTPT